MPDQPESASIPHRLALLLDASRMLGAALDYEGTLALAVGLAVPQMADGCLIDLVDGEGRLTREAIAHVDADKQAQGSALAGGGPSGGRRRPVESRIVASGKPEIFITPQEVECLRAQSGDGELLLRLGVRSMMLVPMPGRQHILGVMSFLITESDRSFTADDLLVGEELGKRVGVAIENAILYRRAREAIAERDAAFAQERQRAEQQATAADLARLAIASDNLDSLLRVALQRVSETLELEICAVLEYDEEASALRVRAGVGWEGAEPVEDPEVGRELMARWAGPEVFVVGDLEEDRVLRLPGMRERGIVSALGARIRSERWGDCALIAASGLRRSFGDNDVHFVRAVAYMLEAAVSRVESAEAERRGQSRLRAMAQALRDSEQRYRQLFESNPSPLLVFQSESLQLLAVNNAAASRYGYSRTQLLGMNLIDLFDKDETARVRESVLDNADLSGVWRHRTKEGELIEVELRSHPLIFDGSSAVLVLAQDITDRRQLEEELRQSQRMEAVGRLAGGVAHDFNNLLTGITSYSELILQTLAEPDPMREDVHEIWNLAHRAASLTRQLLAFSRRQVLQPRVIDLNQIISEMEKMLRRLIGEDVDLAVLPGPQIGRVRADPGQIEQVILNLVINARDAMPRGGKLTISTNDVELDEDYAARHVSVRPGPYVLLAVSDTGCGMDRETQSHIFEPFFTSKPKGKGTGLGLSTVYGIVKQSGGNIWVYSEVDVGTTFKVYLPREAAPADPQGRRQEAHSSLRGSERILLVEDEDTVRSVVQRILHHHGYDVLAARNAGEAMLIAERNEGTIDLLLTDVVLPQMGGGELAERLRGGGTGLRVIFMSGYTDDAIVHHGLIDRTAAFIEKPFSAADLAKTVREVLDGETL